MKSVALGKEEPNGIRTRILNLMDNWRSIGEVLRVLKSFLKEGFIPAVGIKGYEGDVFESLPMFAEREPKDSKDNVFATYGYGVHFCIFLRYNSASYSILRRLCRRISPTGVISEDEEMLVAGGLRVWPCRTGQLESSSINHEGYTRTQDFV